jgi:hypothetical protein
MIRWMNVAQRVNIRVLFKLDDANNHLPNLFGRQSERAAFPIQNR